MFDACLLFYLQLLYPPGACWGGWEEGALWCLLCCAGLTSVLGSE